MMNGYAENVWEMQRDEFLDKAWTAGENNVLPELTHAGYRIDLYSSLGTFFGSGEIAEKYVSNCANSKLPLDIPALTRSLLYLSAYRYSPVVAKPFFWCYTEDINQAAFKRDSAAEAEAFYQIDETAYDSGIGGIQLSGGENHFKFYHFNGSHYPYYLNADGTKSETETSEIEQTKGCFEIIFRALDRMKELDIYEDATIIITADHGRRQHSRLTPLDHAVRIGMFYKPAGKAEEPLTWSKAQVSLANIPATIVKSAGVDYSGYGKALDDVAEDEEVTRYCYNVILDEAGDEAQFALFEVKGDASDFANWKNLGVQDVKYPFYD